MATGFNLPPPSALEIHDVKVAEKWKKFRLAWDNYTLATELDKKAEKVQVATLLTIIGEEARDVFSTFTDWADEDSSTKIASVLQKFADYCQPRKNVPFERYRFNKRVQEAGESYDRYKTALRKLAEGCDFDSITPDEILRDRIVFGIRDNKVRERLLRESQLTSKKTDEICRASESTAAQMKEVGQTDSVSAVGCNDTFGRQRGTNTEQTPAKECGNCGRKHEPEKCRARGKTCNECGKRNHFAAMCRSRKRQSSKTNKTGVRVIEDSDEDDEDVYSISDVAAVTLDDSQLVTFRLDSGNYMRFQPDTGAQCNVIPVHLYKKAAKDHKLRKVTPVKSVISAYGGSQLPVVGRVLLRVWRDNAKCLLDCKLVENDDIRPILGRKACIGMNIIKYTDNDAINKSATDGSAVFTVNNDERLSKENILQRYPKVFSETVG